MTDTKTTYPLVWPPNWPRTRPQDRRPMNAWKKTLDWYVDGILNELRQMKAPDVLISSMIERSAGGGFITNRRPPIDVGVAVYFNREQKQDFAWVDALQLPNAFCTVDEIKSAYRRLVDTVHPDRGGDIELFRALTKHREAALAYVNQDERKTFGFVIAADQFTEVRWNLQAIALTLHAMRQIERCGTSSLLERAFQGFAALPAQAGPSAGGSR